MEAVHACFKVARETTKYLNQDYLYFGRDSKEVPSETRNKHYLLFIHG
jgi:hypothetical protein